MENDHLAGNELVFTTRSAWLQKVDAHMWPITVLYVRFLNMIIHFQLLLVVIVTS